MRTGHRSWQVSFILIAWILLLFQLRSAEAILVGNGRFDKLISESVVIVKLQVTKPEEAPAEMIGFAGEVLSVLKSDGKPIDRELTLKAPLPAWPADLGLEFGEGQIVLLVLQRYNGALQIEWNMGAILPATRDPAPDDAEQPPARKVFLELQSFLETTGDEMARAKLLRLLSLLASPGDLDAFGRHVDSPDPWVRRAAFAAMARIGSQPIHIRPVVDDFEAHLANPENDSDFWIIYDDVAWAARCGSFAMEEPLTSRARAYLPIYRTIVDHAPPDYAQLDVGLEGLKNVGTRNDLPRLYKYRNHEKAWVRHDVLEGLGRILGISVKRPLITSYGLPLPPEVAAWESNALAQVEQQLTEPERDNAAISNGGGIASASVDGVYMMPQEVAGFSGETIELNQGRFRYWFYTDVRTGDEPRYPLTGNYEVHSNRVTLLNSDIYSPDRTFANVQGQAVLWRDDGLELWQRERRIHPFAILVRVSAPPLDDPWANPPSIQLLYDPHMIAREKREYEERYNDQPEPVRTLLRAKTRRDDPDLAEYRQAVLSARRELDPVLIEQLVNLMNDRLKIKASMILDDIYTKGFVTGENPSFLKTPFSRRQALDNLIQAMAKAQGSSVVQDCLALFLRVADLPIIKITVPETGARIWIEHSTDSISYRAESSGEDYYPPDRSYTQEEEIKFMIAASQQWCRKNLKAQTSDAEQSDTAK